MINHRKRKTLLKEGLIDRDDYFDGHPTSYSFNDVKGLVSLIEYDPESGVYNLYDVAKDDPSNADKILSSRDPQKLIDLATARGFKFHELTVSHFIDDRDHKSSSTREINNYDDSMEERTHIIQEDAEFFYKHYDSVEEWQKLIQRAAPREFGRVQYHTPKNGLIVAYLIYISSPLYVLGVFDPDNMYGSISDTDSIGNFLDQGINLDELEHDSFEVARNTFKDYVKRTYFDEEHLTDSIDYSSLSDDELDTVLTGLVSKDDSDDKDVADAAKEVSKRKMTEEDLYYNRLSRFHDQTYRRSMI